MSNARGRLVASVALLQLRRLQLRVQTEFAQCNTAHVRHMTELASQRRQQARRNLGHRS